MLARTKNESAASAAPAGAEFDIRRRRLQERRAAILSDRGDAEGIISEHVAVLKQGCPSLPIENIEMMTRGNNACSCAVALKVLADQLAAVDLEERQATG